MTKRNRSSQQITGKYIRELIKRARAIKEVLQIAKKEIFSEGLYIEGTEEEKFEAIANLTMKYEEIYKMYKEECLEPLKEIFYSDFTEDHGVFIKKIKRKHSHSDKAFLYIDKRNVAIKNTSIAVACGLEWVEVFTEEESEELFKEEQKRKAEKEKKERETQINTEFMRRKLIFDLRKHNHRDQRDFPGWRYKLKFWKPSYFQSTIMHTDIKIPADDALREAWSPTPPPATKQKEKDINSFSQ